MEPDFEKYTLDELRDVEENIDRVKYPDRYKRIYELISQKELPQVGEQESDDALRDLYKEHKDKNYSIWRVLRGAVVMFVAFRLMEYFDWTVNQKIGGAIVVFVVYLIILLSISEVQFNRFKRNFDKRT
jgi:hypothetical protein